MAPVESNSIRVAAVVLLALCSACQSTPPTAPIDSTYSKADVLSGEILFGDIVASDEVPDIDLLAMDEAMRAFITAEILRPRSADGRLRRLLEKMQLNGYFATNYDANLTLNAAETFAAKSGNCLSYTNLFIALAREAGLDARYQVVRVPPMFDIDRDLIIRSNHINVVIPGVSGTLRQGGSGDYVVDFNAETPDDDFQRIVVDDRRAEALVYGNLSVNRLREGNLRESFAYLKKAIERDSESVDLWVNLGVLYSRQGEHEAALVGYGHALNEDPRHKSAMAGLVLVYEALGQPEIAAHYRSQVEAYRLSNPFYHYAVARSEYAAGRYDASMTAIDTALARRHRSGSFHFVKALVEFRLGDTDASLRSLGRAERYGNVSDLVAEYHDDLMDMRAALATPATPAAMHDRYDAVDGPGVTVDSFTGP